MLQAIEKFENLNTLDFTKVRFTPDDAASMDFKKFAPKMKILRFSYCGQLSDNIEQNILLMKNLETLVMSNCESLTNDFLIKIERNCKELKELDVSGEFYLNPIISFKCFEKAYLKK